jgi:hypothetical protein
MKRYITVVSALSLSGCLAVNLPQRDVYNIEAEFVASDAEFILDEGTANINGQAFLTTRGGDVRTCAGAEAQLFPATDYAKERIDVLYRGTGFNNFMDPIFVPDESEYHRLMRNTLCRADGTFSFNNVSAGHYFIYATVTWEVPTGGYGLRTSGGNVLKEVIVQEGETVEVIINGR